MIDSINDAMRRHVGATAVGYGTALGAIVLVLAPQHKATLALLAAAVSAGAWLLLHSSSENRPSRLSLGIVAALWAVSAAAVLVILL